MDSAAIVTEMYATFQRGDFQAVVDRCADDVLFVWTAEPEFARYSGTSVGKQAFLERTGALHADFEYHAFEMTDIVAKGDRVATQIEMRLTARSNGRPFTAKTAHFMWFEEGKLVRLVEYYDSALAAGVS